MKQPAAKTVSATAQNMDTGMTQIPKMTPDLPISPNPPATDMVAALAAVTATKTDLVRAMISKRGNNKMSDIDLKYIHQFIFNCVKNKKKAEKILLWNVFHKIYFVSILASYSEDEQTKNIGKACSIICDMLQVDTNMINERINKLLGERICPTNELEDKNEQK